MELDLGPDEVRNLSEDQFKQLLVKVVDLQQNDRKENQLLYYQPVSKEALKVHKSSARIVGVGGGNRCECAGSRVITDRGMIPIEQVRIGDKVPSRHRWPGTVTGLYTSPEKVPVYEVITKRGFRFKASAEHLSLICCARHRDWHNASDMDRSTQRWVRLDELSTITLKDWKFIAVRGNGGFPESCKITEDDGYFIGLMVGDGSYNQKGYRRGTCSITCNEKETEVVGWIEKYLSGKGINGRILNRGDGATRVEWSSVKFWGWLESVGLEKATGKDKKIPESIWRGTRSVVCGFLRGYADSDGCATTKPSVVIVGISENLVRGSQLLFQRLGIMSSVRTSPTVGFSSNIANGNTTFRLEITGSSLGRYEAEIGFVNPKKMGRLPNRENYKKCLSRHGWDRIKSVELVGEETVYGLSVEPKPEYCSNGFLQHNSSKTETCLVHLIMCATGIVPYSLRDEINYNLFRGPLSIRIVVESLTTTLHQVLLSKLQWWRWTGVDREGGDKGHYGWIPKTSLIEGSWEKSWSEKLRTLRMICKDPDGTVLGESSIQFMSHDQDPSDFASDQFHYILEDEPPKYAIWRENEARTMSVDGRHFLAMTWPDDPSIPVDWLFDEVYDKGVSDNKDIDWINLFTTDNPFLNQETIAKHAESMTEEVRKVRILGQPIRFSNRIHPSFTDIDHTWCYSCGKDVFKLEGKCSSCNGTDLTEYNHVVEFEPSAWPTVFILDPHPRKPHMYMWVQVDPSDDLWVIAESEMDGDCTDVKENVDIIETSLELKVCQRLIDPNMGASPASSRRGITWQSEFEEAGLRCDLSDDSGVGRARVNQYLKPDKFRDQPRLHFSPRVKTTINQMKRYVWDSHRSSLEKDLKQKAKPKNDDYPTMLKYLLNSYPDFKFLNNGAPTLRTR